jgi:ribosomal protein L37E
VSRPTQYLYDGREYSFQICGQCDRMCFWTTAGKCEACGLGDRLKALKEAVTAIVQAQSAVDASADARKNAISAAAKLIGFGGGQ